MKVSEEYENGAIKAIQTLSDNVNEFSKGIKNIAQVLAQILPQVANYAISVYKMVLTPRQYHLATHGKRRVREKWITIGSKRLDKLCKIQKERAV